MNNTLSIIVFQITVPRREKEKRRETGNFGGIEYKLVKGLCSHIVYLK